MTLLTEGYGSRALHGDFPRLPVEPRAEGVGGLLLGDCHVVVVDVHGVLVAVLGAAVDDDGVAVGGGEGAVGRAEAGEGVRLVQELDVHLEVGGGGLLHRGNSDKVRFPGLRSLGNIDFSFGSVRYISNLFFFFFLVSILFFF